MLSIVEEMLNVSILQQIQNIFQKIRSFCCHGTWCGTNLIDTTKLINISRSYRHECRFLLTV